MSELVTTENKAIQSSQPQWTQQQIELLKNTVCKGATDDEFKIFCYAVQRTGLDPFMKQIHVVKRWNNKTQREDMAIQTGIDGYRLIAHRSGTFAGNDAIVFDDEENPKKATATVYRIVQGVRCAFTGTARWAEYYPGDKQGFMWKKMPCVMLGKVAESIALRMAFPAELSGLYTNEEMEQADNPPGDHQKQTRIVSNESAKPIPAPQPQVIPQPISDARKRLANAVKNSVLHEKVIRDYIKAEFAVDSSKELTDEQTLKLVEWIENEPPQEQEWEKETREAGPMITPLSPHELK